MGSQRVGHDWATELNWTDWGPPPPLLQSLGIWRGGVRRGSQSLSRKELHRNIFSFWEEKWESTWLKLTYRGEVLLFKMQWELLRISTEILLFQTFFKAHLIFEMGLLWVSPGKVTLCIIGFLRNLREDWSRSESVSYSVVSDSLQPHGL